MAQLGKSRIHAVGISKAFYVILIAAIIIFVTFNTFPLITGFLYSFTNSMGFGSFDIVGLKNYASLFSDARILNSYLFTIKVAIVCTVLINLLALVLALGLTARIRFKSLLRGIYFVPMVLGSLIIGYVFNFFFTYIMPAITGSPSILGSTEWAWVGIVVMTVWSGISGTSIIYITGIESVPDDVYEAAALDGATGWNRFRYITFPLIMPSVATNIILVMKNTLMIFDQIVAMTGGGPANSTESISYLIYNNGLSSGQFGYQCANAFIFFILITVISVLQTKFFNSKEEQL